MGKRWLRNYKTKHTLAEMMELCGQEPDRWTTDGWLIKGRSLNIPARPELGEVVGEPVAAGLRTLEELVADGYVGIYVDEEASNETGGG